MKLFDRFDKVFLINLKKRTDRLENFRLQVEKYNLGNFELIEAVDTSNKTKQELDVYYSPGAHGLISTNIEILKKAIKENYETICVVEDDCTFNDNILELDSYFEKLPSDWDILYFGGNHNFNVGVTEPIKINERILKLQHSYTTHFVCVKKHMFETLIKKFSTYNDPLDIMYIDFQRQNNVYSFYPGITSQLPGFSDILGYNSNYTNHIN